MDIVRADVLHVLFITHCSIPGHSQIYMVGDMLKVLVIPCDIQHPACFSILEEENKCLCYVRICTQVMHLIVLAQIV